MIGVDLFGARDNLIVFRIIKKGIGTGGLLIDLLFIVSEYRIPPENITVIPNGIDTRRFIRTVNTQAGCSIGRCSLGAGIVGEPNRTDRNLDWHLRNGQLFVVAGSLFLRQFFGTGGQ